MLRAAEVMAVRCPFGCHPELGGPWVPAFAGKTKIILLRAAPFRFPRESGGPGVAMAPLPQHGPQRSGLSAGTMLGFTPPFVSPAKAGAQEPRWRRCHSTDLSAAGLPPARCPGALEKQHPPCHGSHS